MSKSTIPRDLFYPGCASAIFCYVLKKDLAKKKVTFSECLSVEIVVPEQDEEESDEKSNDGFSGIDSLLEF